MYKYNTLTKQSKKQEQYRQGPRACVHSSSVDRGHEREAAQVCVTDSRMQKLLRALSFSLGREKSNPMSLETIVLSEVSGRERTSTGDSVCARHLEQADSSRAEPRLPGPSGCEQGVTR